MGIESGSEDVLYRIYDRKTPRRVIIESAKTLATLGLGEHPRYDLIVNNPLETDESCRETLRLLCDLPKPLNIGLSKLSFFPGYRINERISARSGPGDADEKRYRFWNYLYLLAQYRYFPAALLTRLGHSRFLKDHPWILKQLLLPKKIRHLCGSGRSVMAKAAPARVKRAIKRVLRRSTGGSGR